MATRFGRVALLPVAAALLASCGANADAATSAALTSRLCTLSDLGGNFLHQMDGDFSAQDLAALPGSPPGRLQGLEQAGLLRGRLAFWKASVAKPPFPPPVNAYCQVMEFSTPSQAAAFAASLTPERAELETAGLTFLPDGNLDIAELPRQDTTRVFTIEAADGWNVAAAVRPDGPFVISVYTGGRGIAPDPQTASAVLASIEARAASD